MHELLYLIVYEDVNNNPHFNPNVVLGTLLIKEARNCGKS